MNNKLAFIHFYISLSNYLEYLHSFYPATGQKKLIDFLSNLIIYGIFEYLLMNSELLI